MATVYVDPNPNEFMTKAEAADNGDTLIVNAGTHVHNAKLSITAQNLTIQAASGATPVIDCSAGENTINVNACHGLVLDGLTITNQGYNNAIQDDASTNNCQILNCILHSCGYGIGLVANACSGWTIRGNEIYNMGVGGGSGEAMYLGAHNGTGPFTNGLVELNYIHDQNAGASQGDGIEIKYNGAGNIVRHNVIHNMLWDGLMIFGSASGTPNEVYGNVIWDAGEGILVCRRNNIYNNIVFSCASSCLGIYVISPSGIVTDLSVYNNTFFAGVGDSAPINATFGSSAANCVLANNAVYRADGDDDSLVNLSGSAYCTISKNYLGPGTSYGTVDGGSLSIDSNKWYAGGNASDAFIAAAASIPTNLHPKAASILIGAANATYAPASDFNGLTRTSAYDVGAYETDGRTSNPGWTIQEGFKTVIPPLGTPVLSVR